MIEQVLDEMAARGFEDDDRLRLALATLHRLFPRDGATAALAMDADEQREALEVARVAAMSATPGSAWLDAAFATLHLTRFALRASREHATRAYLVSAWHRLDEPIEAAEARVERAFEVCQAREHAGAAAARD